MSLDFQQQVVTEFRVNAGRVGGPFEGARLLLLTTTGARSGAPHTVPLAYLPDRVNCLTLCAGLHNHHAGEDGALFPLLAEQRPDLAPVLERLRVEHERIAALVAQLRDAVAGPADPALLRQEVDRLTNQLEQHLSYEEERLVPALDAVLR